MGSGFLISSTTFTPCCLNISANKVAKGSRVGEGKGDGRERRGWERKRGISGGGGTHIIFIGIPHAILNQSNFLFPGSFFTRRGSATSQFKMNELRMILGDIWL